MIENCAKNEGVKNSTYLLYFSALINSCFNLEYAS